MTDHFTLHMCPCVLVIILLTISYQDWTWLRQKVSYFFYNSYSISKSIIFLKMTLCILQRHTIPIDQWEFLVTLSKIQFLKKKKIFRNFYHLDRPEGWWRQKLRVATLRVCVARSIGHRPMMWVFKTFSRIRGIERTSNHVRMTHREKTAYPISF